MGNMNFLSYPVFISRAFRRMKYNSGNIMQWWGGIKLNIQVNSSNERL